ncbi:MAG: glycosyltransferase family A protein [Hyphomicrobiaceae bacterium]
MHGARHHNANNAGNCASRNAALAEAKGDIVVIVDADCMLNRSYLTEHYAAHKQGDCDVAIGPMNIETNGAPPLSVLGRHEADACLRLADAALQDDVNLDSFVNCIHAKLLNLEIVRQR